MTWFRVDDCFPEHVKLQALERDPRLWSDAMALWLAGGCYCRRAGTAGFISDERLVRLTPLSPRRARAVAQALADQTRIGDGVGLWVRVEGGWQIHDFADYGPECEREQAPKKPNPAPSAAAERARRYRERKRRAAQADVTGRDDQRDASRVTVRDAERDASRDGEGVTPHARARLHARSRPDQDHDDDVVVEQVSVTRDVTGVTSDAAQHTSNHDRFVEAWKSSWNEARGDAPTTLHGAGEVVAWLTERAETAGVEFDWLLRGCLALYWAQDWPRTPRNNPSPQNLLRGLPGLAGQVLESRERERRRKAAQPDPSKPFRYQDPHTGRWKLYDQQTGQEWFEDEGRGAVA